MIARPTTRLAAVLGLVLVAAAPVLAQRYHVRHYTGSSGLPSSTVRGIVQDAEGRMWLATRGGIASYDGSRWVFYGTDDGLPSTEQAHLVFDSRGTLWSTSYVTPARPAYFDGETWHPIPQPESAGPKHYVTSFAVADHDGRTVMLAGTSAGWLHFWDGEAWKGMRAVDEWADPRVRSIEVVGAKFFIGTAEGLKMLDPGKIEDPLEVLSSVPTGGVSGVEFDPGHDRLWLVGGDWIGRFEDDRFTLLADGLDFQFLPDSKELVTEADRVGGLYFGNPTGAYYFHPDSGLEKLDAGSGLIAEGTTSLLLDREDNLWIGGMRGITKIISRRFASYDQEHGLFADEVTAAHELRSGAVVLGHPGGLTYLEDPPRTVLFPGHELEGRVLDLAEDGAGTLWIAATWRGLLAIDPSGNQRHFGTEEGLSRAVTSVLIDSAEQQWVGTSDGLYRRRGERYEMAELPSPSPPTPPYVRRLYEGPSRAIYVATRTAGVYRLGQGGIEQWSAPADEGANSVYSVFERHDGGVWVGTNTGLHQFAAGRLERVIPPGPAIDRPVYFIIEDSRERIWFGTDTGALRWDGNALAAFSIREGLIGAETNRAGGMLDSSGRIWIGTDRGVSVYREEFDLPRPMPPTVELLELEAGGETAPLYEDRWLGHDHNALVFRFRAISFTDEDRVRFRYRLDGFESEWQEPRLLPHREIRYTHLPPGRYRLLLQAVDVESHSSEQVVSPAIVIRRPFWAQPWFALLAAGTLVALIYGGVSYVAQRRYASRLQRDVRARTEQLRRSERAMAAEKERLAVTVSSISDGVAATDAEGRVALWNPAAERITGWPSAEAIGRPLNEVLPPVERATGARGSNDRTEGLVDRPLGFRTRSGESRLLEISRAPIGVAEEPSSGAVLAFRDITEKQRIEAELSKASKLEALGVLAGGIAHDFNNLLTVLLGSLALLEDTPGLEKPGDRLEQARTACERARSLTQQLLTFSRGGAPVRQAASMSEVIRDSVSFSLSGANVGCEVDLPDDLRVVEIDEGQMSQVVHNLLLNARQAMPDGGMIRIRGRNLDEAPPFLPPGPYILVEVEDSGIGIPQSDRDRVFDPYYSTKDGGSGLGLATAYSIVDRHSGHLTFEAASGRGTVFRVYLPASSEPLPRKPEAAPAGRPGSGRLLVMDDERQVRDVIREILATNGYSAVTAADGHEAIELYRQACRRGERFDAVIIDLTIPGGMGGREAVERLRRIDPDLRAIVLSGYSNDPVMANHRDHGFCAALAKPFEVDELLRVVGDVIQRSGKPVG
jgi:PAS domain S-box-containing protein